MRSLLDFYRQRPAVAVIAVLVGLAVAILTTTSRDGDGVLLPIFFVALAGVVVGAVIGAVQSRRER